MRLSNPRTASRSLAPSEGALEAVPGRASSPRIWRWCSTPAVLLAVLLLTTWLAKNNVKKVEKLAMLSGSSTLGKGPVGHTGGARFLPQSAKILRPEISQMVIYDPRQMKGTEISAGASGYTKELEEMLKTLTPSTMSFVKNLPAIEGPSPDIDVVLSVLLQSTLPVAQNVGKAGGTSDLSGVGRSGLNQNGSVHRPPRDGQPSRRKNIERQGGREEEDATTVQSQAALPRDVFRLRQIQKSRGGLGAVAATHSGSSAFSFSGGGSAFSGDQSASTD